MSLRKLGYVLLGSALTSELVYRLYLAGRSWWRLRSTKTMEVIFFPDNSGTAIKSSVGGEGEAVETSGVGRLVRELRGVRSSLDLALYVFTCGRLAEEVARCQERGVRVRLVTDPSMVEVAGSQVARLRASGVGVVAGPRAGLMHHKFGVLDGRLVVSGSFNWTGKAVWANCENLIICSEKGVVGGFQEEFQRLWGEEGGGGGRRGLA